MKRFLKKLALFLSPFILIFITILSSYLYYDPFKIIHHYSAFYKPVEKINIILNKDYVSSETFINNYPIYKYDSYIFGNSKSQHYHISDWSKYINSEKCFHFDASGENIYGIETKMVYLHKMRVKIKNALIVIDSVTLSQVHNIDGFLYIKDPVISKESYIKFHMEFLKTFFDKNYLSAFYDLKLSGKIKPYMVDKGIFINSLMGYDISTNEIYLPEAEQEINTNPSKYYSSRMHLFDEQKRDSIQRYSQPVISAEQKKILINIRNILLEDKTNYRIIINPLYDQKRINTDDLAYLQYLFGKGNVFDLSGINIFTQDFHNYYDGAHYRPFVAKQILDLIYKQ